MLVLVKPLLLRGVGCTVYPRRYGFIHHPPIRFCTYFRRFSPTKTTQFICGGVRRSRSAAQGVSSHPTIGVALSAPKSPWVVEFLTIEFLM